MLSKHSSIETDINVPRLLQYTNPCNRTKEEQKIGLIIERLKNKYLK